MTQTNGTERAWQKVTDMLTNEMKISLQALLQELPDQVDLQLSFGEQAMVMIDQCGTNPNACNSLCEKLKG